MVPDTVRAAAYVAEQREALECRAREAVAAIGERLRELGYRPVIARAARRPQSVAEYDAWEAERERLKSAMNAVLDASEAAARQTQAEFDAMSPEQQAEFLNGTDELPQHVLYRQGDTLRDALWRHGDIAHGFWQRPGISGGIIWTGTTNARRGYGMPKADAAIVIKPGRAPDAAEIARLVDDAAADAIGAPVKLGDLIGDLIGFDDDMKIAAYFFSLPESRPARKSRARFCVSATRQATAHDPDLRIRPLACGTGAGR